MKRFHVALCASDVEASSPGAGASLGARDGRPAGGRDSTAPPSTRDRPTSSSPIRPHPARTSLYSFRRSFRSPVIFHSRTVTAFTSVYSSSTSWPISRPHPDCL